MGGSVEPIKTWKPKLRDLSLVATLISSLAVGFRVVADRIVLDETIRVTKISLERLESRLEKFDETWNAHCTQNARTEERLDSLSRRVDGMERRR